MFPMVTMPSGNLSTDGLLLLALLFILLLLLLLLIGLFGTKK